MTARPRLWPVLLTAAIGIAMLLGLGFWQVQRLHWKEGLLAEIAAHAAAAPVSLAEAVAKHKAGEPVDFLKVTVSGHLNHGEEKHLISVYDGNPGWDIVTPLVTADGQAVMVERGLVPDDLKQQSTRAGSDPTDEVTLTGVVKTHSRGRAYFDPDNDAKANLWFWWDVPAMLAASPSLANATAAPFVLHVLPGSNDQGFPRPQTPDAGLANNHLQYAITWFALALALAVIAAMYVRGQMKKTGA